MSAMKKMGSLSKLVEMIPGFGQLKMPKELLDVQEGKLEKWKHAMDSMTKQELEEPEIIASSRMERIAKGSGVSLSEIRDLMKQFRQSKKLLKMVKGGSPEKMMKKIQGMGNVRFK
jgi:signal recognition particle subunit SRP54